MGDLLAAPWKRLLLAAGGVALALVLPAGRFGSATYAPTAVRAVAPPTVELGGLLAALDDAGGPAADRSGAAGDPGAAILASLENLGAAAGTEGDAAGAGAAGDPTGADAAAADTGTAVGDGAEAAATGDGAAPDSTTAPGGLGAVIAATLENAGAAGDDPDPGTTTPAAGDLGAAIAATLGASDSGSASRAISAFGAAPTLRATVFGRYLVVAVGLLGWAALRLRAGRPARVLTFAGAALVGYVTLRLLTAEITTTLLVLIVSLVLALSTVVTITIPRPVARRPVEGRAA